MKFKQPLAIATLIVAAVITVITTGCKKGSTPKPEDPQKNIPVPDSMMFVGTGTNDTTIIYQLNAVNGSIVKKYKYRHNRYSNNYIPLVGNGYLYVVESDVINALDINTGALMWSDTTNTMKRNTILHDDTFYFAINTLGGFGWVIYARDATKRTKAYLWSYGYFASMFQSEVYMNYYNGMLFVGAGRSAIWALDAKTGAEKWVSKIPYSIASLKEGIIISGANLLDPATGAITGTIPASLLTSNSTQTASLIYATKSTFFTKVTRFDNNTSSSKIYAYDLATNTLKWSIDAGETTAGSSSEKTIDRLFNNQVIVKANISNGDGKVYKVVYSAVDINTGALKWSYDAGFSGKYFQVDNKMYSLGTSPFDTDFDGPTTSTITAADLNTGKIKWNTSTLPVFTTGSIAACLSVNGKGFAADIQ